MSSSRIILLNSFASLCLTFLMPSCGAQTSVEKLPQEVTDMLNTQVWWDTAAAGKNNPDGLHFQFFKIDEAEMAIGHVVRYRVHLPGAPESEKYSLGVWKIGTKATDL